jgi:hypothetical protein
VSALLWLALQGAAEEPAVSEEVTVYADHLVEQARKELVRDLRSQGYTVAIDRGDHIVLRHPSDWKGEIHIYDDGYIRIKRQPVQFRPPGAETARDASPGSWGWCVLVYPCLKVKGQTVSTAKFSAQKQRTLEVVQPDVVAWADRIADRELEATLAALPERLLRLWEDGEPLEGGAPLATPEARRAAILDYWVSRTDNPWGDAVREAVEAFIEGEIQPSPFPMTAAEVAAANARRAGLRTLEIEGAR